MGSRILLVDDEPSILSVLNTLLTVEGYEVSPVQDGNKAVEIIKSQDYDLMISDIRMTPINGMELLRIAHEHRPSMAVIMVTAFGSVETAVEALRMGAYDYVTKPFKIDELLITVERALEYRRTLAENVDLKAQMNVLCRFDTIVAESPAMKNVCEMVEHVAPTDTTVLIFGESGTGKALIAKTLHDLSGRKAAKYIAINCEALPEAVLEAELFGYVKGAFHGDPAGKSGAFETAEGGTVFLGNIGAMPLGLQEKLVGMLRDKEITRIASPEKVRVNVRVLAGTNTNLEKLIREGKFREDLYYRLSVIPIEIKPLRERREDILPLVYHLILREIGESKEMPSLDPQVREILMSYTWPGNVRELASALRHVVSTMQGKTITKGDMPPNIASAASGAAGMPVSAQATDEFRGKSLKAFLRVKEKEYVERMLEHTKGDKNAAAKALKISLATLYRKLPEKEGQPGAGAPPA